MPSRSSRSRSSGTHGMNVWLAALVGLAVATGARARQRHPRRGPRPALARGHARHARRLPRARLRDPRRRGASRASRPRSPSIGGGYVAHRAAGRAARAARLALLLGILLHATRFGRYLFTLGSNREATRFSGVPVTRVRVTVFALSGLHGRRRRDRLRRLLRLGPGGRRLGLAARRRHRRRARRRRHLRRRGLDARRASSR